MQDIETIWIPLADGARLAARLWLPDDTTLPAPVILEYLPYRRRDRHRGDDAILHPAFAEAGYAAIRVDMRGSGDSDGTMSDEYTAQEGTDAVEVIAWIAAQPWCDGAVGMIGLSWSGFNGLQIAALAPPALKAVVTTCASDDRYADDMHYMGGCLLNDNLQYGATLFTWLGTPPDPQIVGSGWRDMWRERLTAIDEPPAARWMRHPTRDAYWRGGSVCEDYGRIKAAVLAVGGWADGYTNAVFRLLEGLPGPRKGLVGPWGHAFPHVATPGPGIDFLSYVIRWWDHWLRGKDTGIMDEPMLTAWMQTAEPPRARYVARTGHWVAEAAWPAPGIEETELHLAGSFLIDQSNGQIVRRSIRSPATMGLASGEWCPYGWGPDMPTDQREDDAGSLCFDTGPLENPLAILGQIKVNLVVENSAEDGLLAVRLNAVAPDGISSRITYGLLNLRRRHGFDRDERMIPGQPESVHLDLKVVGFIIPAGFSLRLAVSNAYWPLTMPSPSSAMLTLHGGAVTLPVRKDKGQPQPPSFGTPWSPPPLATEISQAPSRGRIRFTRDVETGETTVAVVRNLGAIRIAETGLELQALGSESYRIRADDPATARSETIRLAEFRRADWHARVESQTSLWAEGHNWHFRAELKAHEGDEEVFRRQWDLLIPRHSDTEQSDRRPPRPLS